MNGNQNVNIGNQFNSANFLSNQYSSTTQFLKGLDEAAARKQAKKVGDAIVKGISDAIKQNTAAEEAINKLLDTYSKKAQQYSDMASDDKKYREAAKEAENYVKQLEKAQQNIRTVTKSLAEENEKEVHDLNKVLDLEQQRVSLGSDACALIEREGIERSKIDLLIEQSALKIQASNESDEKAKDRIYDKWNNIASIIRDLNSEQNEINENIKHSADDTTDTLENVNKTLEKTDKSTTNVVSKLKDGLQSFSNAVSTYHRIMTTYRTEIGEAAGDTQINRWDKELDRYSQDFFSISRQWGMSNDREGFQQQKNTIIEGIEDSGVHYTFDQIENTMKEMASFNFTSNETAATMAKDIAYAKEYMGVSSESLKDMYSLQVRTGDDTFMKKTLNTVVSLQKSGISISEQQLDQMIKSSTEVTDAMVEMGMSDAAATNLESQMLAIQGAAKEISPEYSDTIAKTIKDLLGGTIDNWGEYGIENAQDIYSYTKETGNLDRLMEALYGSQASRSYSALAQGDYKIGDLAIREMEGERSALYSQMTDENWSKMMGKFDDLLTEYTNNPDALEKAKEETGDNTPDKYNDMMDKVTTAMSNEFFTLSDGVSSVAYWNAKFDQFDSRLGLIIDVIGSVASIVNAGFSVLNFFKGSGGGKGIINTVKSVGGKIFGSGATSGTLLNSLSNLGSGSALAQTGAGQALAGTTAGGLISGAGIVGGVVATGKSIWDGVAVGTQGFKDENGNRIEGTGGVGDGLAAAVSNQDLYASKGKDAGSGALKGAGVGAMIGTFVGGPVGTLVGGAIGAGVGALAGLFAHNRKEEKKEALLAQKEREKQTAILNATKEATEAIKASRDAVLSSRYDDDRWGTGSIASFPFASPARGAETDSWAVSSSYGQRDLDGNGNKQLHEGIDFAGKPYGTPIGSASNGVVVNVVDGYTWRDSNLAAGKANANYVDIYNEDNGVTYRYYHLAGANVAPGQRVNAGDMIGRIGNTGNVRPVPTDKNPTAGSHLHLSTFKNGSYTNPTPYITSNIFEPKSSSPIMTSYVPNIKGGRGSSNISNEPMTVNSPSIIKGLEQINATLIAMDKRQSDQQRILDALTNTPIHDLGV